MPRKPVRLVRSKTPSAVGMGLVALDVVITDDKKRQPRHFAGGTCGNVLTILSYLGWRSTPVARFSPGPAADRVIADLECRGVLTRFITRQKDGSTPVIIHRIRHRNGGEPRHSFSWRCPSCGAHLPGYKPVLGSVATELVSALGLVNVFFFDRVSRGVLSVAAHVRKQGGLIVFEPSAVNDPKLFREAWALSHIVKYSHERLRDIADVEFAHGERDRVLLEVETLGPAGIRYQSRLSRARTGGWVRLDAFPAKALRDGAGAGDWCSAGLIDKLGRDGLLGFKKTSTAELKTAIRFGQALAAWNCGFEGARGGMYERDKTTFERDIQQLLDGAEIAAASSDIVDDGVDEAVRQFCPSCEPSGRARNLDTRRPRRHA